MISCRVCPPVWRVASCPRRPEGCRRWCSHWSSLCSTPSLSPSCHEARTLLTSTVTGEVRSEGGLGPLTLSVSLLPARGNSLQLCSNFYLQITKSNMSANLKTAAFTKFTSLQVLYYSYVSLQIYRYSITRRCPLPIVSVVTWMDAAGRRSQWTTMSPAIIKNKYKYSRKREPGHVQIFAQMTCKIKVGNLQKCNFIILKIKPPTSPMQHC